MHIRSYSSIYAIGHKAIENLFDGEVVVEEKVDGSQISFCVADGELSVRSKGKDIILSAPEKMFDLAIAVLEERVNLLHPGWIYRGEYLASSKHNVIKYNRIPKNNIVVFDIDTQDQSYLSYEKKLAEAQRIGFECVPLLYRGVITDVTTLLGFLDRESFLGGAKIEGVVVKNYSQFAADKKVAMGKYVSEMFKEVKEKECGKSNPTSSDIVSSLIAMYKTEARWEKAVQHLRDAGNLEDSPRDIGALIREVPEDVLKECRHEIEKKLFEHFWPHICRGITTGLPEWYKERLAKSAFVSKTE